MRKLFLPAILFVLLIAVCIRTSAPSKSAFAFQTGQAECVVDASSLRILHEKNAETPLPNASTTKILTAIIILEDCDLDERICIPNEAAGTEGSSIYLHAGDIYTVEELLYGLMLCSGNDAAVTLALHHSGSIEAFARKMNEKAAMLGATGSHFVNPHGLPDKRHRTTARDLALIAAYAMQNETFRTIVSTKYYAPRHWYNKNKMLASYEGANGIKTGFTTDAGHCLVTGAEREGMQLVCVVLNCPQMYERTAELLDQSFAEYSVARLTDFALIPQGVGARTAFEFPLRKEEMALVRTELSIAEPLPKKKGAIAGYIKIFLANDLIFSQNLYIMEEQ